MDRIQNLLMQNCDSEYRNFMTRLIPTVDPETVMGIRTPAIKKTASQIRGSAEAERFMSSLPHAYFEENQLHGFLISDIKDFDECIASLERFLPYIDNWATCDQTSPKCFGRHKAELLPFIYRWIDSGHTYTVRFGIGMLMRHYLDADYRHEYLGKVASVKSGEYYVNMEIAWYMATALAKQWDDALEVLRQKRLDSWTHNKTIQKACESYRVSPEHKEILKSLRVADAS